MSPKNRQAPPSKHLRVTKRKQSLEFEQFDGNNNQTKRQRVTVTETETLTWKPGPSTNFATSNRFEPLHSSRKRSKWRKIKNKSVTDGDRQWTSSSRDFSSFKDKFVVVSYNILGVENALKHPDLYEKVPPEFLKWERRKKLIREEINSYNASILCFQEVDHFDDLDDLLQMDGFRGVYKARTGEAYDGCAIFWREKLFTLLHQENIEFQNFGLRHNVAQLCVLKMNQNLPEFEEQTAMTTSSQNQSLVVGNIHVLFNPNRGDIKLGQIRLFLEKAYKLSQVWGGIPVLLAGDLNSSPRSALYQFLASSELDVRQHDRRYISGQLELTSKCRAFNFQCANATSGWRSNSRSLLYRWSDEELRLATGSEEVTQLQHRLKLHSAYFGIPGSHRTRENHGEPLATSYHSKFMGTVDYIWHTEELLPVRVLETLSPDSLRRSGGLPSKVTVESFTSKYIF
ncbi:carbon catabolite repressor protein 4-like 5 isoform X1 [Melia azedarach]|uniref:Carbon catabolite repressor protein 4-like 5 isoform X1 n=1 Tax=Melia azedarach TaxID=155640 RepID=A0ACC1XSV6_MELAZ|nr:carbon catabolite repressor protein 4-like 5 isoform X1 [Melia azedarach]